MLADQRLVAQNVLMIQANPKGYFVTGSDTDVGKTYIGCEIIKQLRHLDFAIETRKPAESGCTIDSTGNLITHDAHALHIANDKLEPIERIAPYRYQAAVAPHRAARLEHRVVYLEDLIHACERSHPASCLMVEGAGGFYSPLAEDGLNADLASALGLPVIIVVRNRIGAVNQALMTAEAVEKRQLPIAAIVLNQVDHQIEGAMDNKADLSAHCTYPIYACNHAGHLETLFKKTREAD